MTTIDDMMEYFKKHEACENTRMTKIETSLDSIRENHLAHLKETLDVVQNDVSWLKSFFWLVAGAVITNLAGTIFMLIRK